MTLKQVVLSESLGRALHDSWIRKKISTYVACSVEDLHLLNLLFG